jgi:very-short-patch-repair endonuclease
MNNQIIYNHPELKNRRPDLRHKSTPTESLLWQRIRNSQLGVKFRRQYSVSGYVIDFFCLELRLALEVEGGIHSTKPQMIYDNYRYRFLQALDITILKIKNQEIITNINAVCDKIYVYLNPSHKVGEGMG